MFNSKRIKAVEEKVVDLETNCVKYFTVSDVVRRLVISHFNELVDKLIKDTKEDFGKVNKVKNKKRSTRLAK